MFLRHPTSLLDAARRAALNADFRLRVDGVNLARPDEPFRALLKETGSSGIYLWTARPTPPGEDEHVIYVGRTNSLARRLAEYMRGFQPHSVNDFKLQVFQEQLQAVCPAARLALYFKPLPVEVLAQAEKEAIKRFDPLLNSSTAVRPEVHAEFQRAFGRYYGESFKLFLPAAGDA